MKKDKETELKVGEIAALIKTKRIELKISVNELARRCECSHQCINGIEANRIIPSLPTILRIKRVLDLDFKI